MEQGCSGASTGWEVTEQLEDLGLPGSGGDGALVGRVL